MDDFRIWQVAFDAVVFWGFYADVPVMIIVTSRIVTFTTYEGGYFFGESALPDMSR